MSALLGLFTGDSKWVYIALIVCGLGFVGASALSISLFADKTALHVSLTEKKGDITTLKEEHKKAIEALDKKLTNLQKEKEKLQDKVSKVEALSAQERADAERNAKLGAKKLQEVERAYKEHIKRFEEKVKEVPDYGESDSSIVDAAGI